MSLYGITDKDGQKTMAASHVSVDGVHDTQHTGQVPVGSMA